MESLGKNKRGKRCGGCVCVWGRGGGLARLGRGGLFELILLLFFFSLEKGAMIG